MYHQAVSTNAQQSAQLYKQAASTDAQQFESEECGARLMQSTEVDPCLALSRIDTEQHQADVRVNQLQHPSKESDGYQLQMNKNQEENNESQQLNMQVMQAHQGEVKQHLKQEQIENELCAEDACKDDSDQATSAQPEREQQTEKECEQRDENKMLIETPIPVESQSLERARHAKPILRRSPCMPAGGQLRLSTFLQSQMRIL